MHPLKVSLEELYNGSLKKLSLSRNVLCSKCKGYVYTPLLPSSYLLLLFILYFILMLLDIISFTDMALKVELQ